MRCAPYPLVFATISGAHRYGFPSPDSDFYLRGVHLLPLETVVGLDDGEQSVEKEGIYDGLEIDLVTHDASKFFKLMLRRNGYLDDLIAKKQTGPEKGTLNAADLKFHEAEYERLTKELESAYEQSTLPEMPSARTSLNDLLVRLRLRC